MDVIVPMVFILDYIFYPSWNGMRFSYARRGTYEVAELRDPFDPRQHQNDEILNGTWSWSVQRYCKSHLDLIQYVAKDVLPVNSESLQKWSLSRRTPYDALR